MSSKLPRSIQHGKKVKLPRHFTLPETINHQTMTVQAINDTDTDTIAAAADANGRLSPFLGHSVIIEEEPANDSPSPSPTPTNVPRTKHPDPAEDTTLSSISDIESWDNSSSSSMSWFDDYDNDAMRTLTKELQNIERVLYGDANINILRKGLQDECKEWMDAFPHLSVKGTRLRLESPSVNNWRIQSSLHATFSPRDVPPDGSQTYRVASPKYSGQLSRQYRNPRIRSGSEAAPSRFINPPQMLATESCLQISPAPYRDSPLKRSAGYQKSTMAASSLLHSEMSSSKWHRQSSPEYSSLPYIPSFATAAAKHSAHRNVFRHAGDAYADTVVDPRHRKAGLRSARNAPQDYCQTLPMRNKPLVLPPIEQLQVSTRGANYRSISATPRKESLRTVTGTFEAPTSRYLLVPDRKMSEHRVRASEKKIKAKSNCK